MTNLAIRGAWYLPAKRELVLLFASGRRYRYCNVPAGLAQRFAEAPARGRFYHQEIRNRFACFEIGAPLSSAA